MLAQGALFSYLGTRGTACAHVFAVQPVHLILAVSMPTLGLQNYLKIQTHKHRLT